MINHRPEGRGHPYLVEPDQRVPLRPSPFDAVELRATTDEFAGRVEVELEIDGVRSTVPASLRGSAVPDVVAVWGVPAPRVGEGHLTDAVERLGAQDGRNSWSVAIPPLAAGQKLRYRFTSEGTSTEWHEVVGAEWSATGGELRLHADAPVRDRLLDESVRWLVADGKVYALRFALRLDDGERVVGFGERFDGVDQRGRLVDVAVFDQYKGQGARTYLPMPFAIVVGGSFAFHVDTARRVRFDVGATDPGRIAVEVDLEPGEADAEIVLALLAGTPAEVLDCFLGRVGRPAEPPPDWIYGLWASGNEWNTQLRVLGELERSEREGIATGVVVIEAWSDEQTFVAFNGAQYDVHDDGSPHALADFNFPADGPWPDPKGMVDELHARGTRVLLWQIPLVESSSGQAGADQRALVDNGYCVMSADGEPYRNRGWWFPNALIPDFTSPEVRRWWTEKRRYLVEEVGVDGFKTDGGEHVWGTDLRYADGTHGGETNNRFPVLYGLAYHDLMRSAGRRPVTFSRAGFAGSAAVPCHWAGDEDSTWEAFRASISAGLTAGASGLAFWTWDLGGFSGPVPEPELYLRSAAAAALAPIMQYHSEYNHHRVPSRDRTPWNVAEQSGDERVVPLFRRFVTLRRRLAPYLAEQGAHAVATGLPLMRGLFFDYGGDERTWQFPLQYLLGNDLLVAPVTEPGATSWSVFVPTGAWVDAWTGETVEGPAIVTCAAPLDRIPVFVAAARAGELLPVFTGLGDELERRHGMVGAP